MAVKKSIKQKIKEFDQLNLLLAENLVDAIWIVDAKTLKYEYITASIYRISGYTPDELIDTTIMDRLSPESEKKATALLKRAFIDSEQGRRNAHSLELELMHKNGDTYWVEIRAKLVPEPGKPLKIVGITKDITSRKRFEQQQEDLTNKLVEALAEKEKLIEEIRLLNKLLPICSGCRRIRDDEDKWWPIEYYVQKHTGTDFTHTICPDCRHVLYPDYDKLPY